MKVQLSDGEVALRPLAVSDASAWAEVRRRNTEWLTPWDATNPPESHDVAPTFRGMVRRLKADAKAGRSIALALTVHGRFAGQVTLGGITLGSLRSAYVGYWIDRAYAGRGYTPRAVALVSDYGFFSLRLHRIEINIRPENAASLRVVEKLGFRYEGLRRRYLHIDNDWRDHHSFALCVDEVGAGLVDRLRQQSSRLG
ncbi:MAG: GNAT family N-acetyltransferase [Actinobacteria bacterium]|nr:GNAT family N-acetyltransferase [Actinomycetota bacterium]MCB9411228.1 GNAT family N-acetyltransferase [Actinomycetota bacterium]